MLKNKSKTLQTNKFSEFTTLYQFFLLGVDNFHTNLSLQYLPTHNLISSDISALVLHKPHHDTLKVSKLSSHYDQFCNELSANHLQTFFFFHGHPHSFNFLCFDFRVIQINFDTVNCQLILNSLMTIVQSHNSL